MQRRIFALGVVQSLSSIDDRSTFTRARLDEDHAKTYGLYYNIESIKNSAYSYIFASQSRQAALTSYSLV